jgi:hypothetical protein
MQSRRQGSISGGRADKDERLISVYYLVQHSAYCSWIFAYRHKVVDDVYDIMFYLAIL